MFLIEDPAGRRPVHQATALATLQMGPPPATPLRLAAITHLANIRPHHCCLRSRRNASGGGYSALAVSVSVEHPSEKLFWYHLLTP